MRVISKVGGKPSTTNKRALPVKRTMTIENTTRRKFSEEMDLSLPTRAEKPTGTLHTAKIFIHGEGGIGKTELTSKFPDNLHYFFEPGGEYLTLFRIPRKGQFTQWSQFVRAVDNLVGNKKLNIPPSDRFQTVSLDTADFAWNLCAKQICEEAGVDDINTGVLGYNTGNRKLEKEFREQILRITGSGRGVIFISHTRSAPMEKATGIVSNKLIATIEEKGRVFLDGWCDLVFCYAYVGDERYLIVRGNEGVQAKCRIAGHFYTPGMKEQVHSIPMGESADEAYDNIITAFNNEQEEPYRLRRKVGLSETKQKWKKK